MRRRPPKPTTIRRRAARLSLWAGYLGIALGAAACTLATAPVTEPAAPAFVLHAETIPLQGSFAAFSDAVVSRSPAFHARVRSKTADRLVLVVAPAAVLDVHAGSAAVRVKATYPGNPLGSERMRHALGALRRLAAQPAPPDAPAPDPSSLPAAPAATSPTSPPATERPDSPGVSKGAPLAPHPNPSRP